MSGDIQQDLAPAVHGRAVGAPRPALIVTGLGSPTWDCFAAGDSPEYLYSWGGMGLALPTALGVALAQPEPSRGVRHR